LVKFVRNRKGNAVSTPKKKDAAADDIQAIAKKLRGSKKALQSFLTEKRYSALVKLSQIMEKEPTSAQESQVVMKALEMFLDLSVVLDRKISEEDNARMARSKDARSGPASGCGNGEAGARKAGA
jgi:hypothetical protein